jgi:hypothetical protein
MGVIKKIGSSGQISLGKKFAGQHVLIEEIESGVWMLKTGQFIPKNEQWLHSETAKADIDAAIDWAGKNPPAASDLDKIEKRFK